MTSNIINVVDLEATCYDDDIFPPGEQQEVIEIGLCMLDMKSLTIKKCVSIAVLPECSTVTSFCTRLTGWTMPKLQRSGVSFAVACQRLADNYGSRNRLLVTDSFGDLDLMKSQCQRLGLAYPFGSAHQNVATMFQLYTGEHENISLPDMLARFGLKFEGPRHRGVIDAKNQARLMIELTKRLRGQ